MMMKFRHKVSSKVTYSLSYHVIHIKTNGGDTA